jgi:hypothetical protein
VLPFRRGYVRMEGAYTYMCWRPHILKTAYSEGRIYWYNFKGLWCAASGLASCIYTYICLRPQMHVRKASENYMPPTARVLYTLTYA